MPYKRSTTEAICDEYNEKVAMAAALAEDEHESGQRKSPQIKPGSYIFCIYHSHVVCIHNHQILCILSLHLNDNCDFACYDKDDPVFIIGFIIHIGKIAILKQH